MQSNEDILLIQNNELKDILYAPTHPSIVEPTDIKPFWNFINIARPKVSTTKNEKI